MMKIQVDNVKKKTLHLIANSIIIVVFLSTHSFSDEVYNPSQVKDQSYDELNRMEIRANEARRLYWKGEYYKSLDIFSELTRHMSPSTPLYYNEMALCQIVIGDITKAERNLLDVESFFQIYNTAEREQKALSSFGKESEKIYLGDPYEQAANYLLLTLIYMDRGDYDNALAACKSGLLADSDNRENRFESDFTLLHLLEAKLLQLLGKQDDAKRCLTLARESYINTHPLIRDYYSEKQDVSELQLLSEEQRKKLKVKETPEELHKKQEEIESILSDKRGQINADNDIGPLLSGQYNTLVIVPSGKGPKKSRQGKDGQLVVIDIDQAVYQAPEIILDGVVLKLTPFTEVANISYQAVTRGGRRMDAILEGKAVYRNTTVGAGSLLAEIGNNVGGMAGLALTLVGAAVQGMGGAISPEADTRTWQSLPSSFDVYALQLPVGEHDIIVSQRIYFEAKGAHSEKFIIKSDTDMEVVFAPSTPVGIYSAIVDSYNTPEVKKVSINDSMEQATRSVLVTPPLGFQKIERFPSVQKGEMPEAVAPDWKKIARKIEKRFSATSIEVGKVSHGEIINNFEELKKTYPLAFQVQFDGLNLEINDENKIYSTQFRFSLVETATGKIKIQETFSGIYQKMKREKTSSTEAFYKCFDDALEKFISQGKIVTLIEGSSQSVMLKNDSI